MNNTKKGFLLIVLSVMGVSGFTQSTLPEPVDLMYSNEKIYVVVAVVVTILLGLFLYVINLDRKITKMEQK